ncbi:MAG: sel1 repeat family protein [Bacteroidales bacterium]|nr:sel1 repeat family protein [Bacteroidales bacterium]
MKKLVVLFLVVFCFISVNGQNISKMKDPKALTDLGTQYYFGKGKTQDNSKAFECFSKAEQMNYPRASYYLSLCYLNGDGVELDYPKALDLLETAYKADFDSAYYTKGAVASYGIGLEAPDNNLALQYFEQSMSKNTDPRGFIGAAITFYYGHTGQQDCEKAFNYIQQAYKIDPNSATINNFLGRYYSDGYCSEPNYELAIQYHKKSVEKGGEESLYSLGYAYLNGYGVEKDLKIGFDYMQQSADKGLALAQFYMGMGYYNGDYFPQDYTKAIEWFNLADKQGNPNAQAYLGMCYAMGYGCEQNYSTAFNYFKISAVQGYADGQYNLGICYLNGYGTQVDEILARYWINLAAQNGSQLAIDFLNQK